MSGLLLLQLAFVAQNDAEAAFAARAAAETARLGALSQRLAYRARECGVIGGTDRAFGGAK